MSIFSKGIETLNDLFVHQLQDIYYAEKQIVKNLPAMVEKAGNPQLKQDLAAHLQQTKIHVQRLEKVFEMHDAQVKAVDCPAIDGILKEADEIAGDAADFAVLDAALAAAAQAVEHYEIARYGTLVSWARPERLRRHPAPDARGREGDGPEAHGSGGDADQLSRGVTGKIAAVSAAMD
jgi:ferritin-like metal-binding protein YciE